MDALLSLIKYDCWHIYQKESLYNYNDNFINEKVMTNELNEKEYSWEPEYRFKKIFFKECAVAGLSFHLENDDELWDELEVGTKLALVRDRNNKHDNNAIAVALADDYDGDPDDFDFDFILGYVPRANNAEIAAMLDAGYADKFSAQITTYHRHGNFNDRIRITIYIESKKPEIVRPDLLRAESVDICEFREMSEDLEKRGTAYFRFGGFPHYELQFPIIGEKIVIVHKDRNEVILYLMRVLATDDDCAPYVADPDSIHTVDDTAPFILTNIMGPIKIIKSDYEFLSGVDLKGLSATKYLNKRISDGFNDIFKAIILQAISRNDLDQPINKSKD